MLCGELVYFTSFTKVKANQPSLKPTVAGIALAPV